jgi:hypothetical protein
VPDVIDGGAQGVPRRVLLRVAGALVPGMVLAATGAGVATAASIPAADGDVRGAFTASGYSWSAGRAAGEPATGVMFALTASGRPLSGRRIRFSISSFHAVGRGLWFEPAPGPKSVSRYGYLDLDPDGSGTVLLDPWLRHGDVPTAAVGAHPMLRAQVVGSDEILASARISVI